MIKVLFFAHLRERLGCAELKLAQTPDTVAALKDHLIESHPEWHEAIEGLAKLCAVNQTLVEPGHTLSDGDEVAFFPPVTGG